MSNFGSESNTNGFGSYCKKKIIASGDTTLRRNLNWIQTHFFHINDLDQTVMAQDGRKNKGIINYYLINIIKYN